MKEQIGDGCVVTLANIKLSLLMYVSYFVLFGRFFYKAYIKGPSQRCGKGDQSIQTGDLKEKLH